MTTLTRIFDKVTTGWYFALILALATLYFGSGIYASYQKKVQERTHLKYLKQISLLELNLIIKIK